MPAKPSASALLAALCGSLVALLAGCGADQAYSIAAQRVTVPFTGAIYHAFGDSITYGATLADGANQNYAALLAHDRTLTLTDAAIDGRMACDLAVEEIFPVADSPRLNNGTLYSILISTNDIDHKGAGPYETTFSLCHLAASSWLAIPEEMKIRATAASVTSTGDISLDPSNHWNAVVTNSPGSSISFPLSLAAPAPVYLWYHGIDGSNGTFTVAVDGAVQSSIATAANPPMLTAAGNTNSLSVIRLPSFAAGNHTLTIRQTSVGAAGASIVAVGIPPAAPVSGMPLLLIGTTPRYLIGSGYECAADETPCTEYTAAINKVVSTLHADHLNVYLFNSRTYESGTSADMNDVVHPNVLGQQELEHAVQDVLQ
jgi:hypothetical protein